MIMTWEQMFEACKALEANICLRMRQPGDWYVEQSIEIKDGPFLGSIFGNGTMPQEAVEDHWRKLTELKPEQYIVINARKDSRQAVKWNGYMWESV